MQMRIAVSDFVTNTNFPVFAAEVLGFFKAPFFSLFIFSTKFRLPTATASDHRASRTDNLSRRAISIHWR
jgi:hypothetical protein